MKYRFKIDIPKAKKGDILCGNDRSDIYLGFVFFGGEWINPILYPDLFEPVEEKSDEDLLYHWLKVELVIFMSPTRTDESFPVKNLAMNLLRFNAINPEFLVSLRKGEK